MMQRNIRSRSAIILAVFAASCSDPNWDQPIDIPRDKSEIIGCYWNKETSSVIQIAEDLIKLDEQPIYERYVYGITGRRNLPTIVAWPGATFVYDEDVGGKLAVGTWGDGEGPLNYTFAGAKHNRALQITTFPDGILLYFERAPC